MRNFYFGFLLLLLTSCIQVTDLGVYWDKAKADPALAGTWLVKSNSGDKEFYGSYKAIYYPGGYDLSSPDNPQFHANARSLVVGRYNLLLTGIGQDGHETGFLTRYVVSGDMLSLFTINPEKILALIKAHYPQDEKYFTRGDYGMVIPVFNDDVFKLLSELPDEYWESAAVYIKAKP